MFGTRKTAPKLLDPTGKEISSDSAGNIVDLAGRQLESQTVDAIPTKKFDIQGFVVAAACSDGNMRQVTFKPGQARKLARFLARLHGGTVNLQAGPLFLLVRKQGKNLKPADVSDNSPEAGQISNDKKEGLNGAH